MAEINATTRWMADYHSPHILVNLLSTLMEKAIQIPQTLLANL
jgi:hypothetical protein